MASFNHLFQHTKPRFESPAKVFAKLKSKVQREGISAKEGTVTDRDPLGFTSPRRKAKSTGWMNDELKENKRSGSYRCEASALTLSPISSPQKTFDYPYSDTSRHVVDTHHLAELGHGCSPRKRAFLESTAMSQPSFVVNRHRIHSEPPHIRGLDGFRVPSRTPVKIQPVENDRVNNVFEETPLDKLVSPAARMSSPARKRLKKRTWEQQEFKISSSNETISQPQERKAFSEEENNTCMQDLGHVRGFPADPSEMSQFTHEPMFPTPRTIGVNRRHVMEKFPLMSPAKMFAYMKERESKAEQQEAHKVSSSTRDLFGAGNFHKPRDLRPSTAPNTGEMEDNAFRGAPGRVESADSRSDTDPSEDVLSLAVSPQPVLLEDPLVLNTPRISIPKKQEAALKQNKWPPSVKFPSENEIYLKKWFLRKNKKGLFVEGIHREDNIPWNSNVIVERVSNYTVKTVSGRVYILVGKMYNSIHTEFPKWFLKKFANGFPPDWKALYERFLSESRVETGRNSEGRGVKSKTKSEASSITKPVKQHRKKPLKTPDPCPPPSSSHATVSRSGRVIRPPLEYWKGGRVILDAQMNVTIYECYETSICIPDTTTVRKRASEKPAPVILPCGEASNKEASLRKVKAPLRKRNRAKAKPEEKPSYSPEPPVETHSSSEERTDRRARSKQRRPATERTQYVDTVSQKQSKPEKSSTWSKKTAHDTTRPSARASGRKQTVPAPPESVNVNKRSSTSSDNEAAGRRNPGKEGHTRRSKRVLNKSAPNYVSPPAFDSTRSWSPPSDSSMPSEESENELKKKHTRVTQTKHKQSKRHKSSSPTKPAPKLTQSSKKPKAKKGNPPIPQEQDEDKWTEAELMKLKEAVSYYPKHMEGYWAKVARIVGKRSAEECQSQHTSQGTSETPAKKPKKPRKEKKQAPKDPGTGHPLISARVGTLKRKQEVRQFLENMPKEDVEDGFSCAYMQNKRFEIPSMCPSEHDFTLSDMQPLTPTSSGYPEVKTPQCLHITPGMMGSPNRSNDDKYVFQLQKRMRKHRFNVCKQAPSSKSFTPTPSVKQTMRRCGNAENDNFVVWEMFPGDNGVPSDSGEEEDFYFSENN